MNFDFANPEYLWALLLLPVLALLRRTGGKSGSVVFSSVAIAKSAARRNRSKAGAVGLMLTLLALALLITAFARPRLGSGYTQREESGIDIMLDIDVSGSMAALDFATPSARLARIDAVKDVIEKFIRRRPNDRIGMVAFAANAFLVSPMTLNHDWLNANLARIDVGIVDSSRTAIGSAIVMSVNRLNALQNAKSKVVILLSDGENNAGKISPIAAAEAAAANDVKIYTIAAGMEGVVPVAAQNRDGSIIRNVRGVPAQSGAMMQSSVDEATLRRVAEITQGKFYRATNLHELEAIYAQIDALERTSAKLKLFTSYEELFQWFALAAICVLALKMLLTSTRYRTLP